MASPLMSDSLWAIIEPLFPPAPMRRQGGRPPVPARAALTGILFVLRSGIPWAMLPMELGCGSGVTCCGDCVTGRPPASGIGCTGSCCADCGTRIGSTGAGPASMDHPSRQKRGRRHGSEPHGSRAARHETPSRDGSAGYPAGRSADRRQRPRQRAVRSADRCNSRHRRQTGTSQATARQAARRQSLRSPPLP